MNIKFLLTKTMNMEMQPVTQWLTAATRALAVASFQGNPLSVPHLLDLSVQVACNLQVAKYARFLRGHFPLLIMFH